MTDYTILLIDYAPRSVEQVRAPLEVAGYCVHVASDGPTGVESFEKVRPDVTLIEPMLPKKHGFEVCRELKSTEHGENSAVLILTSIYQGRRYRDQAQHQSLCDGFVDKPVREDALLATIRGLVRDRPARESGAPAANGETLAEEIEPVTTTLVAASTVEPDVTLGATRGPEIELSGAPLSCSVPALATAFADATEAEIMDHLNAIMPD